MGRGSAVILTSAIPALLVAVACERAGDDLGTALETITADDLARHVQVLASDSFGGRAPSSPGEEKTISYLKQQFAAAGLGPGNGDSWFQEVPLVSITADPGMTLQVAGRGVTNEYEYGNEFMAWTLRVTDRVDLSSSDMVFVGYGVVAPEFGWNDYAGLDVDGKTVVMLVNDPGYATGDTALFNGNAMTYYGRWTYKFAEAARQGAAAAIIVHETAPAGYPWEVVSGSWSGPQFHLESEGGNMDRAAVEGWVTLATAREIFAQAGLDYEELKTRAAEPGFEAVPMGLEASLAIRNTIDHSTSNNVLGLLRGGARADEYIIYTAHWDHMGVDPSLQGDSIYNGARDNATGTAGLIELAEAFQALPEAPARSILFLAVTAEEQGLLGSKWYATHPVYPLDRTVAALNMDAMNIWGPTNDVTVVGYGMSELDEYARAAAGAQGRHLRPDPEPEKGFYYRSDHFEFAKQGVPALYLDPGIEHVEKGEEWFRERLDEYTNQNYHKPSDEYEPSWNLEGLALDLRLFFRIGQRLAATSEFPTWREGTEFRAIRQGMMEKAASGP